jgi:hypothetical protein
VFETNNFLSAAFLAAILTFPGSAIAQDGKCQPFDAHSSGEFRERHSQDLDGDGALSKGDKRIGHRVLQDAQGNKIGDRYYATTTLVVDANDKEIDRVTETVNVFGEGAIFATKQRVSGKDLPSNIIGGTGIYAGAQGTVTVERDGKANVYHFEVTCS